MAIFQFWKFQRNSEFIWKQGLPPKNTFSVALKGLGSSMQWLQVTKFSCCQYRTGAGSRNKVSMVLWAFFLLRSTLWRGWLVPIKIKTTQSNSLPENPTGIWIISGKSHETTRFINIGNTESQESRGYWKTSSSILNRPVLKGIRRLKGKISVRDDGLLRDDGILQYSGCHGGQDSGFGGDAGHVYGTGEQDGWERAEEEGRALLALRISLGWTENKENTRLNSYTISLQALFSSILSQPGPETPLDFECNQTATTFYFEQFLNFWQHHSNQWKILNKMSDSLTL